MSSIDTRVVEAKFKNDQFAQGVSGTMSMLDKLKAALMLPGATKGLQDVNAAAGGFNSSAMEQGAGRIAGAFSSMQAVAFGALASVGAKAMAIGSQVANSFTFGPITDGFKEYETKIGSIQTILANTMRYGTQLPEIKANLEELNNYADKTIYNFGDMTKNIGLFTNAGIKVGDATKMIQGFSNVAAASGTGAEQAAGAARQLAQALSVGTIRAQDWISLTTAQMGNKNMQEGLVNIAKAMGQFNGNTTTATAANKDFKGSLEKGWLSADVMSSYLRIMAGDMDAAAMKSMGLTDQQIKDFTTQQQMAEDSATKVRTFTQLMGTMKEAVGSGWASTFEIIFGDFNEATDLFTSINNSVSKFIGNVTDARNSMLQGWKDGFDGVSGRTALIDGLGNALAVVGRILGPIGQAFRQLFPRQTARGLFDMTIAFRDFMEDLIPSVETVDRLRRTFAGVFAVLHIGWTIIKAVAKFFFDMFAGIEEGDKGILRITANIGDFLVGLDKAITAGGGINKFFDKLKTLLFALINPIKDAGQAIGRMFDGLDLGPIGDKLGKIITAFLSLGDSTDKAAGGVGKVTSVFDMLMNMGRTFAKWANSIADYIAGLFDGLDYNHLVDGLQTGVLAALVGVLGKLTASIKAFNIFGGRGQGGIFEGISSSLEGLAGSLKAMQNNLNATALLKLAGAIAILAIACMLLSTISGPDLTRASIALGVMFAELTFGMQKLSQGLGTMDAIKLTALSTALILLGFAIGIMVISVKALSEMEFVDLVKGLGALQVMLLELSVTVKMMNKNTKGMITAGIGLTILAIGIRILVNSVQAFADMSWGDIAKGLTGVGALLLSLALFTKFAESGTAGLAQGAGILLLAIAIRSLTETVITFSKMSWTEIAKGMSVMVVMLGAIAGALKLIPASSVIAAMGVASTAKALGSIADVFLRLKDLTWSELARGLIAMAAGLGIVALAMKSFQDTNFVQMAGVALVAVAVKTLAEALKLMGSMSWEELAKGLTGLAGTLLILSIAMNSMEGSIAGALALLVIAAALRVLAPVIIAFSQLGIAGMAIALGTLAGVFIILGIAGYALAGAVPVLLGLGVAIALLGAAVFLAGAGLLAFAVGLSIIAAAGAGATAAIVAIVAGLVGLIPMVMEQIGLGIVAFANVIATSGPAILGAITAVLTAFLQAIIDTTPKVVETLLTLLFAFLSTLNQAVPAIIQTGLNLLVALLAGIAQRIPTIVTLVVDIITRFINTLANNLPKIIQSGINLILAFMNGVGDAARNNGPALADAAWNLATGLVDGFVSGIKRLGSRFKDAIIGLAKQAWNGVLDFFGINSPSKQMMWVSKMNILGLVKGIEDNSHRAERAYAETGGNLLDAMGKSISGLGDLVNNSFDEMTPTITPVLDLSAVKKDSSQIAEMLAANKPISLDGAIAKASNASSGLTENQLAALELAASDGGNQVTFIQNNNSPKALSAGEIYRNTNSQLSRAKEALKT